MVYQTKEYKSYYIRVAWIFVAIILTYGLHLRYATVVNTEVYVPIRADAKDYFNYATNISKYHIFSRQSVNNNLNELTPDALRSPGYPFFASIFVTDNKKETVEATIIAQTVVQIICFSFLTAAVIKIFGIVWSVPAVFLLWTFPHFVTVNTYYLSESIFISALAILICLLWEQSKSEKMSYPGLILVAILFGITILIKPVIQYFPVFLLLISVILARENFKKAALFTLVSWLPLVLWNVRNLISIGSMSDPTLTINAIFHGSYPSFMYNSDPETFGFPYRFDPLQQEYYNGIISALSLIWERANQSLNEYLHWYVIGKQAYLWQWSIIAGQGDIYIYPVIKSPFIELVDMKFIRSVNHLIHGFWVWLGLAASLFVAISSVLGKIRFSQFWIILSMFLTYVVLIHMIIAPFPRYGIPFKLFAILFSVFAIKELVCLVARKGGKQ